jgi:hypothetical protein
MMEDSSTYLIKRNENDTMDVYINKSVPTRKGKCKYCKLEFKSIYFINECEAYLCHDCAANFIVQLATNQQTQQTRQTQTKEEIPQTTENSRIEEITEDVKNIDIQDSDTIYTYFEQPNTSAHTF